MYPLNITPHVPLITAPDSHRLPLHLRFAYPGYLYKQNYTICGLLHMALSKKFFKFTYTFKIHLCCSMYRILPLFMAE